MIGNKERWNDCCLKWTVDGRWQKQKPREELSVWILFSWRLICSAYFGKKSQIVHQSHNVYLWKIKTRPRKASFLCSWHYGLFLLLWCMLHVPSQQNFCDRHALHPWAWATSKTKSVCERGLYLVLAENSCINLHFFFPQWKAESKMFPQIENIWCTWYG